MVKLTIARKGFFMGSQTIKVSLQSIEFPAINFYVHIVSVLLILFLLKKTFGDQIFRILNVLKELISASINRKKNDDWMAFCRTRKYWPQKQDSFSLDLKGMYIKSLDFTVFPISNPQHWRAGFVIGNEKLKANEIVDTTNGITIHTGSDLDDQEKIIPIWKFYNGFDHNNPDSSLVNSKGLKEIKFSLIISNENFMRVKVENDLIFAQKVDASFRRRVYLKGWVDTSQDCEIKFKNINYSLWS
ncbi:hypothetical protein A2714_01230 [Candidatus Woesebacteria bacterium RIFCSPHIGHO2_01_FULL_38_9]|uniref:Uncharacterized protein n=2 Tax=Candidatus Woeseibacteriota TaxID=1752722 RepID=A0A1F7XZE4_9BACT|nr:MAG: hypothetical protein A2714_01230 [Candidatus Woesebacteria bacterium RIFCSPHIGHO2_01_FULL_38_9]